MNGRRGSESKIKDLEGYSSQHYLNSEKTQKLSKCSTIGKWPDKL